MTPPRPWLYLPWIQVVAEPSPRTGTSLAERLRELEPEYWADLAQRRQANALRPVRVGHSSLRRAVDELGQQLRSLLSRFGLVHVSDLQQMLENVRPGVPVVQHFGEKLVPGLLAWRCRRPQKPLVFTRSELTPSGHGSRSVWPGLQRLTGTSPTSATSGARGS
jgi:hypothetical protein